MDNNNFQSDDKRKDMTNHPQFPAHPDNNVPSQVNPPYGVPHAPQQPPATPQAPYAAPQQPYTPQPVQYNFSQPPAAMPVQQPTVMPSPPVQQPTAMPVQPVPTSPISHAPAVAVGRYNDGLAVIWTGLVLNLTALYPLFTLLTTLDNPRHMTTLGDWMLICAALFAGTILSGFGVKEKGYQKESIRIFGVISFFVGVLFFFIPVAASLLYAAGIGN